MSAAEARSVAWRSEAGVPVRSLWALLIYAHGLAEFIDCFDGEVQDAAELPDLLARLLVVVAERRLRRDLSRAYQPLAEVLTRVRGRIDVLATERGQLLSRGRVACRHQPLTVDTPRNRLVRAALERSGARVGQGSLARDCLQLARELARRGVSTQPPSRAELAREQLARHDAEDGLLVTVARLVIADVLPGETEGGIRTSALSRHETLLREVWERAVGGLYRHHLHGRDGWRVRTGRVLHWRAEALTAGLKPLLPTMQTDIELERAGCRLVIDTKFTGLLTTNAHGQERLKRDHLFQLYAYLRSQEGADVAADAASGLLLYPTLDLDAPLDEAMTLQGHRVRLVTVDLATRPDVWREHLLSLASLRSS